MRRIAMAALVLFGCAAATDFDRYGPSPAAAPDGGDGGSGGDDDDDDVVQQPPKEAGADAPPAQTSIPKFVQSGTGHANGTIAATIGATTAGNLLVVAIANEDLTLGTVASITDNAGNTYESANVKSQDVACEGGSEIWFAKDIKAGATTVTVTMQGGQEAETWVIEASGLSKTAPFDVGAVTNDGAKSSTITAPPVSPSVPRALIVSTATACEDLSKIKAPNVFTNLPVQVGEGAAWHITEGPGSFGAVWEASFGSFNASTAAFKP